MIRLIIIGVGIVVLFTISMCKVSKKMDPSAIFWKVRKRSWRRYSGLVSNQAGTWGQRHI